MKNIHILPTDKPSRLWVNNLLQGELELSKEMLIGSNTAQNIYITSDEEIKEGDWIYDASEIDVIKCPQMIKPSYFTQFCKKIILTTDQDLIKNGVQAIDDDFLEWFVKNQNCEEVKIGKGYFKNDYEQSFKIIIPKEEVLLQSSIDGEPIWGEPKQETLEEVLERLSITNAKKLSIFLDGIKYQQERSYSEEDMKLAFIEGRESSWTFEEWFEQFKKK